MIISSPSKHLIRHVSSMLFKKKERKDPITIGKRQLLVDDIRSLETKLRPPFSLITGTPIIMRISSQNGKSIQLLFSSEMSPEFVFHFLCHFLRRKQLDVLYICFPILITSTKRRTKLPECVNDRYSLFISS